MVGAIAAVIAATWATMIVDPVVCWPSEASSHRRCFGGTLHPALTGKRGICLALERPTPAGRGKKEQSNGRRTF